MLDFAQARRNMVDCQIRTFDVTDRAVLAAMGEVPRERFTPAGIVDLAYLDRDLEIGTAAGETRLMLQPMVLARLLQALEIADGDRVLDVAGGLGYSAALLARLGARVTSLEADDESAARLRERLAGTDVDVRSGPIDGGVPGSDGFDAILVNGAVERTPSELIGQLKNGGRLVCIQTEGQSSRALLHVRTGSGASRRRLFDAVAPSLAAFRRAPGFVF